MSRPARPHTKYQRITICSVRGCNGWANRSGKCPGHDGKSARHDCGGRKVRAK